MHWSWSDTYLSWGIRVGGRGGGVQVWMWYERKKTESRIQLISSREARVTCQTV